MARELARVILEQADAVDHDIANEPPLAQSGHEVVQMNVVAVLSLDLRADDRATLPDDVLTNNADRGRPIPRQSALNDLEVRVLDDTRKHLAELLTLFPCAPVPLGTQDLAGSPAPVKQRASEVAHVVPGLLRIGRRAQDSGHLSEEVFKLTARRGLSAGQARDQNHREHPSAGQTESAAPWPSSRGIPHLVRP